MEKIASKNKNYTYAASDESLLSGIMYKWMVYPLLKVLPYHIPANIITIVSNSLVSVAFFIAMQAKHNMYWFWPLIPICVVMYLVGDYTDGEQARRSKTSSPLGEFIDHFLDSFVTAQLLCMMMTTYQIHNPLMIAMTITCGYFTQSSAFWERYKNGHMTFTKFSSTETILLLTAVTTIGGFEVVRNAASLPVITIPVLSDVFSFIFPGTTLLVKELVIGIMWFCSLYAAVTTLIRTKGASYRYIEYLVISGVVCTLLAALHTNINIIVSTLVLFHVNYICSLLSSIVMKKKDKHPDFFLAALMIAMTSLRIENELLSKFYFLYVLAATGVRVSMFFNKNKHYWYWINPAPEDDSAKAAIEAEGNTSQY